MFRIPNIYLSHWNLGSGIYATMEPSKWKDLVDLDACDGHPKATRILKVKISSLQSIATQEDTFWISRDPQWINGFERIEEICLCN